MTNQNLEELRNQIENKYHGAISALDSISSYLAESSGPQQLSPGVVAAPQASVSEIASQKSHVDLVSDVISNDLKTVDDIVKPTDLNELSGRAVLHSKSVIPNINQQKPAKKEGFKRKQSQLAQANRANGETSVDSIVWKALVQSGTIGLDALDVVTLAGPELRRLGLDKKAISAALHNMKVSGRLLLNENTGVYKLRPLSATDKLFDGK